MSYGTCHVGNVVAPLEAKCLKNRVFVLGRENICLSQFYREDLVNKHQVQNEVSKMSTQSRKENSYCNYMYMSPCSYGVKMKMNRQFLIKKNENQN